MASLFVSYSHKDEALKTRLLSHLSTLKNERMIEVWHDRELEAGDEFDGDIRASLERAEIILLLISADFLASDYVEKVEIKRALERRREGTARVIPTILRACDWRGERFAGFVAVPKDGKAVTAWRDRDAAFTDIAAYIRKILQSPRDSTPEASEKPQRGALVDLRRLGDALDTAAGSIDVALVQSAEGGDNVARALSVRDALKDIDARLSELVSSKQATLVDGMQRFLKLREDERITKEEKNKLLDSEWQSMINVIDSVISQTARLLQVVNADRSDMVLEDFYKVLIGAMREKLGLLARLRALKPPFDEEETLALDTAVEKFDNLRKTTSESVDKMSEYIKGLPL